MVRMTFDEFVEKMRSYEIYRHSHLLTMDTIENYGKNFDTLLVIHREMMEKINDEKFMFGEYIKYCNS